jgi:fructose-bisphosphate aldolase class 1
MTLLVTHLSATACCCNNGVTPIVVPRVIRNAKAEDINRYHERRRKDLQNQIEKLIEQEEESKMPYI